MIKKYFNRGLAMNENKEKKDNLCIQKLGTDISIDEIMEDVKHHVGNEYEVKIDSININYHSDNRIFVFVGFRKKQKVPVFVQLPKTIENKLNEDRENDEALVTIGDAVINALENYYEV